MRVGVLGLGRMGLPIARRLARTFDVRVFDPAIATDLPTATSAGELAAAVDVLVTVLPGAAEVDDALPALLDNLKPAGLWLDLTSGDPRMTERLAEGLDTVGAPMGGGPEDAANGTLSFFVGGPTAAVARARPLLDALGTVDHVGEGVGDGYTAKLLANLLWFGQAVAVTEALLLGQARGIPPARLRTVLATSAGGSRFIDEYLDKLLGGDYLESFGLDRCVEELEILASLARDAAVPFELSETVARLHREALERFGAVDGELLSAKLLEERAGRDLRA